MAARYGAGQYEDAFSPHRLQNWSVPRPGRQEGSTPIVADDRGHLLPTVPRSQASPWGTFVGTWDMPPRIPPARLDLTSRSAAAAARLIDWIRQPTALTCACNGLQTEITGKRKASENRGCADAEAFPEPPAPLFHSLLFPGDHSNGASSPGRPAPAPGAAVSPARSPALQQTPPQQRGLAQTHLPQRFCPAHSPPSSPAAPHPHLCTMSTAHISLAQPQEPPSDMQTAKEPGRRSSRASSEGIQPAGPPPGAPPEELPGPGAEAPAPLFREPGCTEVQLKADASPEPPAARQPCSQQAKHGGQTPRSHQPAVTDLRRGDAGSPKIPASIHPAPREASPWQATPLQVSAPSRGGSAEAEPRGDRSPGLRASPRAGWGEAGPGRSAAGVRARRPSHAGL